MRHLDTQICGLTGISMDELSVLRFNTAYDFLSEVMGVDAYGLEVMPKTPLFWNWWSTEWMRVDDRFMENLRFDIKQGGYFMVMPDGMQVNADSQARRLACWKEYHEASNSNYYISRELVELSYHNLIKEIVR